MFAHVYTFHTKLKLNIKSTFVLKVALPTAKRAAEASRKYCDLVAVICRNPLMDFHFVH